MRQQIPSLYGRNARAQQNDNAFTLLEDLFKEHRFTHVVHLAAQAGVRYSLNHPLSYVKNNLECYVTLLEVVRKIDPESRPSLSYASVSWAMSKSEMPTS